jgi:transmembrane sensor
MREVVTTAGQRAEVRLGDGSRVILGVDSRLRFPVTLGKHSRDLELFGQAYFEVQHDPNRPFRVRSGGVITEDLGTEFVVRAYAGDSTVRVAVVSGQVSVRPSNGTASASPTMLAEGDLATVTEDGLPSVTHDVNVESYLGWTKGRIEFRGTGLAEVARDLGRWYGLEIRLASPALERLRLTATFRNEPIEQVLHLITASLDLSADRAGDTVTLRLK